MAVDIIQNLRAKAKESKRDQRNQRDEIEDMKDEIRLLKSRLKRQGHASYPRRR
ncbi:hypothetical protein PENSPDRAFT_652246 [Peniophora sp. CONT]|nr:hypothetical protein PENSPDRAFT_652246 [Peniophora sp. CONT]